MIKTFLTYKAREAGKLVIEVPAQNSSRECSYCGCVDKGNRPEQAVFRCLCCGFEANADYNASVVLRNRGVKMLLEDKWKPKNKKKLLRLPKAKSEKTLRGGSPRTGKAKRCPSRSCPQESPEAKKSLLKAALTAGSQDRKA